MEVVLSAMSVEKTTTTLLKRQVLSLVQLVVYVVYEEAIAMGQATSANLLLITELSEALMWRLAGTAATSAASGLHTYAALAILCGCACSSMHVSLLFLSYDVGCRW